MFGLLKGIKVEFSWKPSLVVVWNDSDDPRCWALHLGVDKGIRVWGYALDWYDGPIYLFGFGPLFLVSYMEDR